MAAGNVVRPVEEVSLHDPSSDAARRSANHPSRGGFASHGAFAGLRDPRHPCEPINRDPSTSLFFISNCSTTSGDSDV